jgi:hypothetical protein
MNNTRFEEVEAIQLLSHEPQKMGSCWTISCFTTWLMLNFKAVYSRLYILFDPVNEKKIVSFHFHHLVFLVAVLSHYIMQEYWCLTIYNQHSIIHQWSWKNPLFRRSRTCWSTQRSGTTLLAQKCSHQDHIPSNNWWTSSCYCNQQHWQAFSHASFQDSASLWSLNEVIRSIINPNNSTFRATPLESDSSFSFLFHCFRLIS